MAAPPAFPLTLPLAGEDHLGPWRTRYLRRTARRLLETPGPLPGWLERAWAGVVPELGAVLGARPSAFYGALLLPQVAAPLLAGRLDEAIPTLLLELARARVLGPQGVWWGGPVDRLLSPALGLALGLSPARAGMVFRDGEAELAPGDVWGLDEPRGETAFFRLKHGGWLGVEDNNPLALVEAHPGKQGNAVSLGSASVLHWVESLDSARAVVKELLPGLASEHAGVLATILPVGGPMEMSLSASYREAPGLVYVSLHDSTLTMAEALVHEVQHNKLNLVSHADPLLEEGGAALHQSPVRPDARPLWGVLLAAHALLPVERLHQALRAVDHPWTRESGFDERAREVREGNRAALATLRAHARPTPTGAALIQGMERLAAELSVGGASGSATPA